jgi:hypothetical protein
MGNWPVGGLAKVDAIAGRKPKGPRRFPIVVRHGEIPLTYDVHPDEKISAFKIKFSDSNIPNRQAVGQSYVNQVGGCIPFSVPGAHLGHAGGDKGTRPDNPGSNGGMGRPGIPDRRELSQLFVLELGASRPRLDDRGLRKQYLSPSIDFDCETQRSKRRRLPMAMKHYEANLTLEWKVCRYELSSRSHF